MQIIFVGSKYRIVSADKTLLGLVWLSPFLASFTFLLPVLMAFFDLDPPRYILDYFLPFPTNRSRLLLLCTFLSRYAMLLLTFLEAFRSLLFHIFVLTMILNRITLIFHLISKLHPSPIVFYKLYLPLYITLQGLIQLFALPVNIILSAYFAGIVTLSWVCIIMTTNEIGTLFYCWVVTLLISAIVLGVSVLKTACKYLKLERRHFFASKINRN